MIWLVSPQNPLKSSHETASLAERIAGAQALAQGPGMIVSARRDRSWARTTPSTPSAALKARFPGVKFVWIMGADSLASFHRWKGWTQIMHEVPVAVVSRPWISLKSRFSPAAQRFARFRRADRQAAVRLPGSTPPAWVFLYGPVQLPVLDGARARKPR